MSTEIAGRWTYKLFFDATIQYDAVSTLPILQIQAVFWILGDVGSSIWLPVCWQRIIIIALDCLVMLYALANWEKEKKVVKRTSHMHSMQKKLGPKQHQNGSISKFKQVDFDGTYHWFAMIAYWCRLWINPSLSSQRHRWTALDLKRLRIMARVLPLRRSEWMVGCGRVEFEVVTRPVSFTFCEILHMRYDMSYGEFVTIHGGFSIMIWRQRM